MLKKCKFCGVDTIRGKVPTHLYTCPLDDRERNIVRPKKKSKNNLINFKNVL